MLAIQHSIRNRQVCIIELALNQIKAVQSMDRGYDATTNWPNNFVTGYSPTTKRLESADEARFFEIKRLATELKDYLNGGPMTLSDADW